MDKPVIEARGLGKRYDIAHMRGGYVALRDVIATVARRPFSFLARKAKRAVGLEKKEEFWALRGVDFTISRGEVVGVIGANGAGKSTLLKILSQITPPTEGEVILRGRVGSLLEVGTGFHPELTGRENIFLNGAILGMKKKEIAKKFDEIVAFAGVEKFLDTPVKHYSSGMYVRLAFSVAAHMEPDILIIDEVLAVGDAEFQKKCLDKMDEIAKKEGRTVLFVSHNLAMVQSLCGKTIWLDQGKVKQIGPTKEVVGQYVVNASPQEYKKQTYNLTLKDRAETHSLQFTSIDITNTAGSPVIYSHDKLSIALKYASDFSGTLPDCRVVISIVSERSRQLVHRFDSHGTLKTVQSGLPTTGKITCESGPINLTDGRYLAEIEFWSLNGYVKMMGSFDVITDITKYGFSVNPDKDMCDYVVDYSFKSDK